ncbi:MAG: SIR2 family protein [Bacteroidales bacterium]|nr:SIR2 family protein [Bacteroidales bacterium]
MTEMLSSIPNLNKLEELYEKAGDNHFALFLGAGVNSGSWAKDHPVCASWLKLLEALDRHFHPESRLNIDMERSDEDWITLAGKILDDKNKDEKASAIDKAIYSGVFRNPELRVKRENKHKVLTWTVLKGMDTLRAVICFSAAIRDPKKIRSMRRNPKVGRILTTNYDFFFSAAWPRYTSMKQNWWPVTWKSAGSHLDKAGQIIYLHGYLPYSGEGERDVILTREDYDRAYSGIMGRKDKFAWYQLTDTIKNYHVIFLGFSFLDVKVSEILKHNNPSMQHFVFVHSSESKTIKAAVHAGVKPVILENWSQLPVALEHLYVTGITQQEFLRTQLSGAQYWDKLKKGLEPRKK